MLIFHPIWHSDAVRKKKRRRRRRKRGLKINRLFMRRWQIETGKHAVLPLLHHRPLCLPLSLPPPHPPHCRPPPAVPLSPLPALHSLAMALNSTVIFTNILLSSLTEIRNTPWFRRTKTTPFQWLLCFPLGTRLAGWIFFWSYAFYLSRFLHLLRTFFAIVERRPQALARLFSHSALVCMSFLWLEFSQSFQVVAILSATLAYVVVFGYRFWVGVGLFWADAFSVVVACQVALLGCNLVCHLGVLHLSKGAATGSGRGCSIPCSMPRCSSSSIFMSRGLSEEEDIKGDGG